MTLVSNTRDDNNQVTLEIRVDGEEFANAQTAAFNKNVKDITIPGFRKGKAPRHIIEKMYGENVFTEEAVNLAYPAAYEAAAKEADIHPVDSANVEVTKVDHDGFTFKAVVTVRPIVKIDGYKGLKVNKVVKKATDADVDHELDHMKEKVSRMVNVTDRAAKEGDQVILDYSGSVDGVKFDGGTAEKQTLNLGSGMFIPGFEEQVAGHSVDDEFDVNVTFPEDYNAKDLAGKAAVFACKLHEIRYKEYPPIDDEFAKDVSDFDTLDELKADILKRAQERFDKNSEQEMKNDLLDQVADKLEANIPEVMIEKGIDNQLAETDYRMQMQGLNLQMYLQYTGMDMATMRKNLRPSAESGVKIRLALEQIADQEKLAVDDEAVEAEYKKLSEQYQTDLAKVKEAIPAEDIKADLSIDKAIELVTEAAVVTEVTEEEAEKAKEAAEKKAAKKAAPKKKAAKKEEAAEEKFAEDKTDAE